jgi:hypothetical protein
MDQATEEPPEFVLPANFRRDTVEASLEAAVKSFLDSQRKITRQSLELKSLRADVARLESELAVARIELAQRPVQTETVAAEPWRIEDQAAWLVAAANQSREGSY